MTKTAIVTGSSKGIGFKVTELFLKEGYKVAGWSRSKTKIDHKNFIHIDTDMGDEKSVLKALESSKAFLGDALSVLINNAGLGYFSKTEEMSSQQWLEMFNTNVHGIFYATKAAIPYMRKAGGGHIFNIASIAGLTGVQEGAGYSATKFAVRGFSESLFKEVRKDNIKVSCIYPGSVNTEFFRHVDSVKANDTMLWPEDVADMILYFINTPGNFLPVNIEIRPMAAKYN
ncbi:MAG: SDR family NAD(P)-dependent oxidoreductase [Chitinophagaceae bacterium]|nr:MAG: SDR family NAD(P)-dependent oxidoreductase [Chitinophagaceae bacterium]